MLLYCNAQHKYVYLHPATEGGMRGTRGLFCSEKFCGASYCGQKAGALVAREIAARCEEHGQPVNAISKCALLMVRITTCSLSRGRWQQGGGSPIIGNLPFRAGPRACGGPQPARANVHHTMATKPTPRVRKARAPARVVAGRLELPASIGLPGPGLILPKPCCLTLAK